MITVVIDGTPKQVLINMAAALLWKHMIWLLTVLDADLRSIMNDGTLDTIFWVAMNALVILFPFILTIHSATYRKLYSDISLPFKPTLHLLMSVVICILKFMWWKILAIADLSPIQIMLRKLISLADLTICLDKRNASGKIEMYQVRNTPLHVSAFKLNFFVVW
jgi:hypothetical protein